jgi:TP901-1 family phage major tail protein
MATPTQQLVNGSDFVFFLEDVEIGGSRTCSISVQSNMLDITTKQSQGGWAQSIPVSRSWSGTISGLAVWAEHIPLFHNAIKNKTLLDFAFKQRVSETNAITFTGACWIESYDIEAGQDEAVSYSVNFTGYGELVSE